MRTAKRGDQRGTRGKAARDQRIVAQNAIAAEPAGQDVEVSGPIGRNAKALPTTGQNAKALPTTGQNAKTLPTTGQNAKALPTTGQNAQALPSYDLAAQLRALLDDPAMPAAARVNAARTLAELEGRIGRHQAVPDRGAIATLSQLSRDELIGELHRLRTLFELGLVR